MPAPADSIFGQSPGTGSLADIVYLDSIVVRATKADFSVPDFIALVENDQSFYQAFRNLRFASYIMETQLDFENRKAKPLVNYAATHRQYL